jgi:RimJ/RimL family protein N-acetyltransferase
MGPLAPPTLQTERLLLRPFSIADAPRVQLLAGEREVASTTLRIPHPYGDGLAESWIAMHPQLLADGKALPLAIVLRASNELIGAIGLEIDADHERAELGYWIGKPYWGQGYCTEAARAIVPYAFQELGLNRIVAHYFARNPASGRVMEKLGMRREGVLRQDIKKWGKFEDRMVYGLLREDFALTASCLESEINSSKIDRVQTNTQ